MEDEEDEAEEAEEDEEDDLMRLVRRQREAFSARVAAGRPSIRHQQHGDLVSSSTGRRSAAVALATTPGSVVPVNAAALSKNERLYRTLVKKYVGKAARARLTLRRDKVIMAKRAAKDCAKAVRQRQAGTQKPSRDATCQFFLLIVVFIAVIRNYARIDLIHCGPYERV